MENLLPHLIKEGRDVRFKLFFSSRQYSLPVYDWLKEPNVKLYEFKYPNNILFALSRSLNKPFVDKIIGGADVFFFPHFFISSLSPNCKRVTTFHDLSYLHFPEHLTLKKKFWHNLQMNPRWQAKFSDKIIAVSESTKNDLINFYKIDPARIEIVYSGVNKTDFKISDSINVSQLADFKKQKNLPERFVLFLGKLEPRKNIVSVVRAFNNLKANPKYKDVGLVIAGAKGWKYGELMSEVQRSFDIANPIIFTGQLTDEERNLYYRAAEFFVYPSFFEGFGFPPLEAMSCGTPVIASRNSSIPEVLSDAAILVDPYDVLELKSWMAKLLDDDKLSNTLVNKGIKQASKFSWSSAAVRTLKVLKETNDMAT